jgi:hypothetical protein
MPSQKMVVSVVYGIFNQHLYEGLSWSQNRIQAKGTLWSGLWKPKIVS